MAKYWLFLDNQVTGPYDPEALRSLPGFGPEALICPEGRKGTDMGDWQRASLVPELRGSGSTPRAVAVQDQFPSAASAPEQSPAASGFSEFETEDKISSLEMAFGGLHEQVRKDEDDMLNMHRVLDDERKNLDHWVRDISGKVSRMEERVSGSLENSRRELDDFKNAAERERQAMLSKIQEMEQAVALVQSLKEKTEAADAARQQAEVAAQDEARLMDDMKRRIEELQSEISLLRGNAFGIGGKHGSTPELGSPATDSPGLQAPPDVPSFSAPVGPQGLTANEGGIPGASGEPAPMNDFSLPPFSTEPQAQEPVAAQALGVPTTPGDIPQSSNASKSAQSDMLAGLPPIDSAPQSSVKAKSGKKGKALVWVGLVFLAAGALFAFEEGLIPLGNKVSAPPVAPPPAAPQAAAPGMLQAAAVENGFKKQAILLVQNWALPKGGTIGAVLQSAAQTPGNSNSSWEAEKASDGVYQVNFYGTPSQNGGPLQNYQFNAQLDDHQVIGLNKLAQDLLNPPSPPPVKKAHKRRRHHRQTIRIRPKVNPATPKALLPGMEQPSSQAQSGQQGQSATAGQQQAGGQNTQAQDAQLLDNLLKP